MAEVSTPHVGSPKVSFDQGDLAKVSITQVGLSKIFSQIETGNCCQLYQIVGFGLYNSPD
jgi:hypothetical protein